MTSSRASLTVLFFVLLLPLMGGEIPAATPAQPAKAAEPSAPSGGNWLHALLPNPFSPNPDMEMTVITEMTDEGRKLPAVSPGHPAYYTVEPSGDREMGGTVAREQTMPPEDVGPLLVRGLAVNGYKPAQLPGHPPSLLIFYVWGTHNHFDETDGAAGSFDLVRRNVLDRALLVGGKKFSDELAEVIRESQDWTLGPPPVELFKMRKADNERLLNQTLGDVFYVVASAFDYQSVAKGTPVLLWRTSMTVSSQGVWMKNALPAVVADASQYFGREMTGSAIMHGQAAPAGKVEVGTPTVVGNGK